MIEKFLKSSPTSQALDQTNPLAALAHRRRVTLLGEGGLKRESVPADLRNVHPSQFGRICLIDGAEGPSVGLRHHLALYASADEHGRLAMAVMDAKTGAHQWVYADDSATSVEIQPGHVFTGNRISHGSANLVWPDYMAGFSSSLLCTPFLEHTDAARAVMSAGHQCQALPPYKTEVPLVQTGGRAVLLVHPDSTFIAPLREPSNMSVLLRFASMGIDFL